MKSSKKVTRKLARRIRSFDEIQRKDELKGAGLLPHKPGSQNRRK